jgi:hypothetical protein
MGSSESKLHEQCGEQVAERIDVVFTGMPGTFL